jgi:hypothetical protein
MTEENKHARASFRGAFVAFSLFLLVFYWLVVATYPAFFFFNPFEDPSPIRQAFLMISLGSWLLISLAPAIILVLYAAGKPQGLRLLPLVALMWPSSVVANQLLLLVRDGRTYFDYLLNHPIFIATDIVLPLLLLVLYRDLKIEAGRHAQASAD